MNRVKKDLPKTHTERPNSNIEWADMFIDEPNKYLRSLAPAIVNYSSDLDGQCADQREKLNNHACNYVLYRVLEFCSDEQWRRVT